MKKINKKINKQKKINKKRGFIILFSMLISSLILLISSGMYTLVNKQVILSSYARESQKAFYAADAALDCALFNDVSPIINETVFPLAAIGPYSVDLNCGGGTTTARLLEGASYTGEQDFDYSFVFRYYGLQDFDGEYIGSGCAYVLVEKKTLVGGEINTRITASGFNVCKEGSIPDVYDTPDFNDPTLLERRLSASYIIG